MKVDFVVVNANNICGHLSALIVAKTSAVMAEKARNINISNGANTKLTADILELQLRGRERNRVGRRKETDGNLASWKSNENYLNLFRHSSPDERVANCL